ncbi:MAG TPA: hypothetical protein QF641_02575 [Candidatus Thalassarchaeaceae archaeon]|nr:hypothetical protein [Candidatus Thalassarchaeaceae archaeon]
MTGITEAFVTYAILSMMLVTYTIGRLRTYWQLESKLQEIRPHMEDE